MSKHLIVFFLCITFLFSAIGIVYFWAENGQRIYPFLSFTQPTPIINITTLDYLKLLQKGIVKSSILTNEYEGTITSIDTKGGKITYFPYKTPVSYKMSIQILGSKGEKTTFYYTEYDLKHLIFLQKDLEKTIPIAINDIHTKDHVTVTQSIDWLSKPPRKIKTLVVKF